MLNSPKSRFGDLKLSLLFGYLGFHRFYIGKVGNGVLYLLTGGVRINGTIIKSLTNKDQESLDETYEINKKILLASEAKPETITRRVYESGHPCCTAPIGKVVDENQETKISNLFVSDASVFPSLLGMPPILTIVALSKKLTKYLLTNN